MSMVHYSMVLENCQLLLRDEWRDSDKPVAYVHYWPTRWNKHDITDFATGEPCDVAKIKVQRHGATYYVYFPDSRHALELRLPGDTKSIRFETVDIPQPKTRKGIELRWHNGAWCKCLKSGLVPVC